MRSPADATEILNLVPLRKIPICKVKVAILSAFLVLKCKSFLVLVLIDDVNTVDILNAHATMGDSDGECVLSYRDCNPVPLWISQTREDGWVEDLVKRFVEVPVYLGILVRPKIGRFGDKLTPSGDCRTEAEDVITGYTEFLSEFFSIHSVGTVLLFCWRT